MSAVELLPKKLIWARVGRAKVGMDWRRLRIQDIEEEDFCRGEYNVCHYTREQCGAAFGPLSLGQALRFCQVLDKMLQEHTGVVVEYTSDDSTRANTATMIGCFLILQRQWTVEKLNKALPEEGQLKFPCAWARPQIKTPAKMKVTDCWAGWQVATKFQWVQPVDTCDEMKLNLAISQYNRLLVAYDAAWIVPNQLMVMADPMTTIVDPSPETCPALTREGLVEDDDDGRIKTPMTLVSDSDSDMDHFDREYEDDSDSKDTTPASAVRYKGVPQYTSEDTQETHSTCTSVHSVVKGYTAAKTSRGAPVQVVATPPDLVSFLNLHNIGCVVRMNESREPGLREIGGSYHAEDLRRYNIEQQDFFTKDTGAALPTKDTVLRFLELVDSSEMGPTCVPAKGKGKKQNAKASMTSKDQPPALVIHCKSGFGRSAMMACLAMIHIYDIPGRVLMGWARIARPGAFTVPEQEQFLHSLQGRRDLHRCAGYVAKRKTHFGADDDAAKQGCCTIA